VELFNRSDLPPSSGVTALEKQLAAILELTKHIVKVISH
jgi:hypothetical protein